MVEGFVKGSPNAVLMDYASRVQKAGGRVALDIGCGAARNALPLAASGWRVLGTDLSWPMLEGAERKRRDRRDSAEAGALFMLAPMEALPVRDRAIDLVIAHGIWNLAHSDDQFRRAVAEAARVSRPGAALFVFTFSRHTLAEDAQPLPGQTYTFTQFSGTPQIFLTDEQLIAELARAGFVRDTSLPITEYNRQSTSLRATGGGPVIYEAAFRAVTRGPGGPGKPGGPGRPGRPGKPGRPGPVKSRPPGRARSLEPVLSALRLKPTLPGAPSLKPRANPPVPASDSHDTRALLSKRGARRPPRCPR